MLAAKLLRLPSRVQLTHTLPRAFVRLCHSDALEQRGNTEKIAVYSGLLLKPLKAVKYFSLGTSAVCLSLSPLVFTKFAVLFPGPLGFGVALLFVGLSCSSSLIMHGCMKGYVTELRFEPSTKKFEADTLSFFNRKVTTSFTQEDVTFPEIMGPFTSLRVKGEAMFIFFDMIENPEAFECILKYDKEIDLLIKDEKKQE